MKKTIAFVATREQLVEDRGRMEKEAIQSISWQLQGLVMEYVKSIGRLEWVSETTPYDGIENAVVCQEVVRFTVEITPGGVLVGQIEGKGTQCEDKPAEPVES